jgi:hypothetical protein
LGQMDQHQDKDISDNRQSHPTHHRFHRLLLGFVRQWICDPQPQGRGRKLVLLQL